MDSAALAVDFSPIHAKSSAPTRLLAYILIVVGILRLVGSIQNAPHRNDFAHYYLSANILLDGKNPYLTPLEPYCRELGLEYSPRIAVGANPPLLIRTMTVIARLPLPVAFAIWGSLQLAALCGLLAAIRRLLSMDGRGVHWLLLEGVILNATCLQRQFHYSQVQIVVAVGLAAALVLHNQKRRTASCALVALVAAFKLYPAVLLPWFLLTGLKSWRDFLRRALAVAGVAAIVLALTGFDAWRSFVVDGLPIINRSVEGLPNSNRSLSGSVTNYSLPSLVAATAVELWGRPLPQNVATVAKLLANGLAAAAIVGAYLVVWRRRLQPVAAVGVLTAAMIAASPVCWSHYFVLMILPVAWVWQEALPPRTAVTHWLPLIAGALCLWPELDWTVPLVGGLPRMALHFYPLATLACVAFFLASRGAARGGGLPKSAFRRNATV